jgi:C-terminal processing protease CtpA/Prc
MPQSSVAPPFINVSILLPKEGPLGMKPVQRGHDTYVSSVSGQSEEQGVRKDDKIVAVNGAPMQGLPFEEVVNRLKTPQRPLLLYLSRAPPAVAAPLFL